LAERELKVVDELAAQLEGRLRPAIRTVRTTEHDASLAAAL
jgi:hypothetical protein